MNVLVTAGNTQAPIDRVRCITNIFTGRTGAHLALTAANRGHRVTLLTSHPEVVAEAAPQPGCLTVEAYRTFDDLGRMLESHVRSGGYDAAFHAAAVSDYLSEGVYGVESGTHFDGKTWTGSPPRLIDRAAGKVKSDELELWLRLVRAPKLVDRIRSPWGFAGVLVKFKLEVGKSEAELEAIAEKSRQQSSADLMVANTLEGAADWALVGPMDGRYQRINRAELSRSLVEWMVSDASKKRGENASSKPR
jgi:phosphopantothenate-cysteine ligase/phosphopantothenoylcysteine decarboxylase/phosphopantothenate--cysteine ligase